MAQVIGARSTGQIITETRQVRNVSDDGLMLEPEEQPLVTFLVKLRKGAKTTSPRMEWFEDDFVARWGQNGTATVGASAASVTVTVTDGTQFVPGDIFLVPNAVTSSTAPEQVLVTAVVGNVLTVVRAFAGTTVAAINENVALAILGTAYEEGGLPPSAKATAPVGKISYTQIFKKTVNLTKTQVAHKTYGAPNGERVREHAKLLKQMKIDMNRQFLFGKASEALTGGPVASNPLRTTMGLNSVITTNVVDAGGVLTRGTIEAFARSAFRYGKGKKLLIAAPRIISAFHDWGNAHQQLSPNEKVFGVNLNRIITGHGEFMIVRDWMLEDGIAGKNGFAGWAFAVDLDELEYKPLIGHGENRDLRIEEDVIQDGRDAYVDEALAEVGLEIHHEKKHAKLYNVQSYSA